MGKCEIELSQVEAYDKANAGHHCCCLGGRFLALAIKTFSHEREPLWRYERLRGSIQMNLSEYDGYRGTVLLIPAHERMRTERGIATFGPRYFGYDRDYIPVERLMEGTSG